MKAVSVLILAAAAAVTLFAGAASAGQTGEKSGEKRIAVLSGTHHQRQGFAVAVQVESDRGCLELAQTLALEIGASVQVACSRLTGEVTVVADCGFTAKKDGTEVGPYLPESWAQEETAYLACVKPLRRFPAVRVEPDLGSLRR